MRELVQLLQDYLLGAKGLGECAEWLAGVDWDDPNLTGEEKDLLGLFELLITDVAEGLREEREFWEEASQFIAKNYPSTFTWQAFPSISFAIGTATTSTLLQEELVSEGQVSQSWNISLQVVPS